MGSSGTHGACRGAQGTDGMATVIQVLRTLHAWPVLACYCSPLLTGSSTTTRCGARIHLCAGCLCVVPVQARRTAEKGPDGAQAAPSSDDADAAADVWRLWQCHGLQGASAARSSPCILLCWPTPHIQKTPTLQGQSGHLLCVVGPLTGCRCSPTSQAGQQGARRWSFQPTRQPAQR